MQSRRREFLGSVVAGAAAFTLSRNLQAQTGPATTKVSDRVSLITGCGNNAVVLTTDAGSLLVDCGDAAHAGELLKLAGPAKIAFNTHWHLESTGGNDVLAKSGAKLVSHVSTQLWMTQEIPHDWENRVYPPRAKTALPTEVFYTNGTKKFGGETIEYGLLPMAHTDGDIFVHFKDSDVLVTGDAVQPGRLPVIDWRCDGWIGGMQDAQKTLLGIAGESTRIIPGSGPVMTKADLQASLETVTKLREQMVKLLKQGLGPRDMIAGKAVRDFEGQLAGNPDQFIYTTYRGLWAHARELGGIV